MLPGCLISSAFLPDSLTEGRQYLPKCFLPLLLTPMSSASLFLKPFSMFWRWHLSFQPCGFDLLQATSLGKCFCHTLGFLYAPAAEVGIAKALPLRTNCCPLSQGNSTMALDLYCKLRQKQQWGGGQECLLIQRAPCARRNDSLIGSPVGANAI